MSIHSSARRGPTCYQPNGTVAETFDTTCVLCRSSVYDALYSPHTQRCVLLRSSPHAVHSPFNLAQLSQHVLDLMHRHRDDVDNVPFVFLTPTRRPISRPSSRASSHSARLTARPDTPTSAPSSPLAMVLRRPHTPLMSPLAGGQQASSYVTARSDSPGQSPVIPQAQFASSLPASPLSSPRIKGNLGVVGDGDGEREEERECVGEGKAISLRSLVESISRDRRAPIRGNSTLDVD